MPSSALSATQRPYILKVTSGCGRSGVACFDEEYIRRLVNGDPEIESHFVSYFGEFLAIKLRGRVHSPQLAEDIRQETFLRVLRNLRNTGMQHPERLGAYVNSVCTNVMLEAFRSESRFTEIGDDGPAMIDARASADKAFVTRERREQVALVLAELSAKDRDLLETIFLEEESKDEVCRRFNVDRDYLRVLLHRARVRFREVFLESFGSGVGGK